MIMSDDAHTSNVSSNGKVLLPQHLADLRRSGLTDSTIHAAGLFSISSSDKSRVKKILNW